MLDPAFPLLAIELALPCSGFTVSRWAVPVLNVYVVYGMKILCQCDSNSIYISLHRVI